MVGAEFPNLSKCVLGRRRGVPRSAHPAIGITALSPGWVSVAVEVVLPCPLEHRCNCCSTL